jgi:hypothetical protein
MKCERPCCETQAGPAAGAGNDTSDTLRASAATKRAAASLIPLLPLGEGSQGRRRHPRVVAKHPVRDEVVDAGHREEVDAGRAHPVGGVKGLEQVLERGQRVLAVRAGQAECRW